MTQEEAKYILEHTVLSWSVSGSDAREAIQMAIKELDRKKGKWIPQFDKWGDYVTTTEGYKCSECGEFDSMKDNFCPNCGAEMAEK